MKEEINMDIEVILGLHGEAVIEGKSPNQDFSHIIGTMKSVLYH
jgi:hypothetical protein